MPRTSVYATVDPSAVAETFQAAAAAGKVVFHVRRSDGTLRRMSYLKPGSPERRVSERIEKSREKGVPMKDIADKLHISVPTVRRIINNLELSKHVEAGTFNYALELVEPDRPASFQRQRTRATTTASA